MKKVLSFLTAAVMVVSLLAVNVSAEAISKTAKAELEVGKSYTLSVPVMKNKADYKIVMPKSGNLTFSYVNYTQGMMWALYDSNGNSLPIAKSEATVGTVEDVTARIGGAVSYSYFETRTTDVGPTFGNNVKVFRSKWNTTSEKAQGHVTYKIDRGTYYLRISRFSTGTSNLSLKVSAKDLNGNVITSEEPSTEFLMTVTLKKGDVLALSSTVSNSAWRSTNPAVATVASGGAVTAVAAGQTDIEVNASGKILKIRVIVRE